MALTLAVVTGCGDDDDAAGPDDGTTTTEAPDTTLSPEAEVEAAYLAYWEMLERLAAAPNPDDPEIAQRASGKARSEVTAGLSAQLAQGTAARTGPQYRHTIVSTEVREAEAVVGDCAVDDSTIVNVATGESVGGGVAATGLLEVTLVLDAGAWTVESVKTIQTWPGDTSCET